MMGSKWISATTEKGSGEKPSRRGSFRHIARGMQHEEPDQDDRDRDMMADDEHGQDQEEMDPKKRKRQRFMAELNEPQMVG